MNRNNLLLPFMLFSLSNIYAVDLTLTDKVINTAVDATEGLQSAMENVVNSGEGMINYMAETIESSNFDQNVEVVPEDMMEVDVISEIPEAITMPLEEETPTQIVETVPASITKVFETNPSYQEETEEYESEEDEEEEEETPDIMAGSIEEGHKIFLTNLKPVCGITGAEFAANYSQEEWEEILEVGEFKKVLIQLCPKAESVYNEEWEADLVRFSYEYANDSDSISDC